MRVNFNVPDVIWAQLVESAEERDTTVGHLLSAATGALTHKDSGRKVRATARRNRVLELVRAGLTDREVARLTGELKQYVADNRRRAGLPANRAGQRKDAA